MLTSYQNTVADKPSVRSLLTMGGIATAPIVSMLKSEGISNTLHSWYTDEYAKAKDNANPEVSGIAGLGTDTKKKLTNATQILKNEVSMSWRKRSIEQYTGDEWARQLEKVGKEHMKDIEYALLGLNNTTVFDDYVYAANDTDSSKMAGFFNFIPTANRNSAGGAFTLELLNATIEPVWANSGVTDHKFKVFMSSALKRKVNDWVAANSALRVAVTDRTLNLPIDRIMTDFGEVDIIIHPLFSDAKLKDKILVGDFSDCALRYLDDTQVKDFPTSKTADAKLYYTDCTLEVADPFSLACAEKLQ